MSESLLGRRVAATRQKAGRLLGDTGDGMNPPPGMLKAPAATDCAIVMVVSGRARDARLSQVAASDGTGKAIRLARAIAANKAMNFHRLGGISNRLYARRTPAFYISSKLSRNWASVGVSAATAGLGKDGFDTADLSACRLGLTSAGWGLARTAAGLARAVEAFAAGLRTLVSPR